MPRPRRARPALAARDIDTVPQPASAQGANPEKIDSYDENAGVKRGRKTRSMGARLSMDEEAAMRAVNLSRDAALDRLANEDATTTTATSGPAAGEESDTGSSVEIGRRVMATPAHRRDTTGLDLADDDIFGDLDDSFGDGDIPHAPRSADASSLTMSSIKPRSRQSSFIGRNDPPIRPSSRGGSTPGVSSTFNIGVFRRRAREPSILGTSRKPRPEPTASSHDTRAESDEDDFAPEAESTPLNNKRRRTQAPPESEPEDESQPEMAAAQTARSSKKRKSEDAHTANDRPEKSSRHEEPTESRAIDIDSDSELSSLASSPRLPEPALPQRPSTPVNMDEVEAPPASSDSEAPDTAWPDIHTLAKRRRRPSVTTPVRADHLSDISSPPSLTHSPNFPETRNAKARGRPTSRRQASPNITTADLTSLLPKRRYKKTRDSLDLGSDEELDTTGLGEDEDELSYLDTRAARKRKGSRSRPQSRAASRPASRPASRSGNSALKPKATPASAQQKSRMRTYSRRSSDKENESEEEDDDGDVSALPDGSFDQTTGSAIEVFSQHELKEAAKKFKEVDKWELEFEEVVEGSSPPDAR